MDCWALKVKGRRKKAWTAGPSRWRGEERRHGLLGPQGEGAKKEGMDCWALKVKGRRSLEKLLAIYQSTRCNIPQDLSHQQRRSQKHKHRSHPMHCIKEVQTQNISARNNISGSNYCVWGLTEEDDINTGYIINIIGCTALGGPWPPQCRLYGSE